MTAVGAIRRSIDLARETDFAIAGVRILPAACEVIAGDRRIRLQPRVMQVLVALARAGGRPMSREALFELCWDRSLVGEDALNRCIQRLRRLTEKEAKGAFVIETIARVGYRLSEHGAAFEAYWHSPLPPSLPHKPSIAVLPFADLAGSDTPNYFIDGMMVDIVAALARFETLFVIASGTSLSYRGDPRGGALIARELGVRYILQGSVRSAPHGVRIAVELVDAIDGVQILAERYDGTRDDVFALHDAVANAVASQIEPGIVGAETLRARSKPTATLDTYDLFLRGFHLKRAWDRDCWFEALPLLEQAIANDPDYPPALALALAGYIHALLFLYDWAADSDVSTRQGLEYSRRALRTGGDDPQVLAWAGMTINILGDDLMGAEAMIERALARNPGSSYACYMSAWLKLFDGRTQQGLELFETALRLDPRSPDRPIIVHGIAWARVFLGRFESAVPLFREAARLRPGQGGSLIGVAVACAHMGRLEDARAAIEQLRDMAMDRLIDIFRAPRDRAMIRSGIALARGET